MNFPATMTARRESADRRHMAHALRVGRRALGTSRDNPPVGCLIVKDGQVVGIGVTAPGGRPHAETEALAIAGEAARGATAYVTLEPCCHQGRTGPCVVQIVESGIARAVVSIEDPNPLVSGRGFAFLREHGVRVDIGLCADRATSLNQPFFTLMREGRPFVVL